jgi:outer membrane protein
MKEKGLIRSITWSLGALALAVAASSWAQSSELRIGFVNIDRILRDAAPAKAAQEKIEREFKRRDEELSRMAEQLRKTQETLDKQGPVLSEADRRKLEREFSDTNRDFQRKQREFRDDVNQRRNEELQGILERANRIVREIAEREKYDIIFQDAVWASARIDVTDKVIKALDAARPPAAGK